MYPKVCSLHVPASRTPEYCRFACLIFLPASRGFAAAGPQTSAPLIHGTYKQLTCNTIMLLRQSILKREVDRYQRLHMKGGTALGELDHPSYLSPTFRSLNLSNISHQVLRERRLLQYRPTCVLHVTQMDLRCALPRWHSKVLEVYWDGDSLMGVIEVLPTPSGNLLMELYREGCQVGVSSRGWASLKESPRGCITVQGDFELITYELLPSSPAPLLHTCRLHPWAL